MPITTNYEKILKLMKIEIDDAVSEHEIDAEAALESLLEGIRDDLALQIEEEEEVDTDEEMQETYE